MVLMFCCHSDPTCSSGDYCEQKLGDAGLAALVHAWENTCKIRKLDKETQEFVDLVTCNNPDMLSCSCECLAACEADVVAFLQMQGFCCFVS
jgi:hypothetical protein